LIPTSRAPGFSSGLTDRLERDPSPSPPPRGKLAGVLGIAIEPAARQRMLRRASCRLASLLPVAVPAALVSVFLGAEARSLIAPDSWLALVGGREIAAHGLPSADHLTVFASGRSWVDQQWLVQILFYRLDQWAGTRAITALSLLGYLAAFVTAAGIACRRAARGWAVGVFFVVAVASSPWAMGTGPQSLALPLFAFTLLLVVRDPDATLPSTLWLLPLLCVWANLHGSAALGAFVTTLFGLQALLRKSGRRLVAGACLLAPLTLLVSPYALELPGYYRLMLIDHPFAGHVELWQRTTPGTMTAVFFVLAVVGAVLVVCKRRALAPIDLIVLAVTLAAGLEAVRGIVWFALAALALLPSLAGRRPQNAATGSPRTSRGLGASVSASALLAGAAAAIVWGSTRPAVFYDPAFPPALRTILQGQPAHRSVFVDGRYADWLLWEVPPLRGRIAYDARVELLTRRQAVEQERFHDMTPGWQAPTNGYGLVVSDPKHVEALVSGGGWRPLYAQRSIAVAERAP
jgi:hypothetical protein